MGILLQVTPSPPYSTPGALDTFFLVVFIIILVVIYFLTRWIRPSSKQRAIAAADPQNQKICRNCGYVSAGQRAVKGSGCIEVILWLSFIIPGLIYSVWRHESEYKKCPKCGQATLIPLNSPVGQKLLADLRPPIAPPPVP